MGDLTLDANTLYVDIWAMVAKGLIELILIQVTICILCGLPRCIVCRDSLVALGDNKTLICASFYGKNACFQGKSWRLASGYLRYYISRTMSHTHFVHCNWRRSSWSKRFALYVCTAVLQCSTTFVLNLWAQQECVCILLVKFASEILRDIHSISREVLVWSKHWKVILSAPGTLSNHWLKPLKWTSLIKWK